MTATYKFRNRHGDYLWIRADFAQASSPLLFSWDGEDFHSCPFQVADARHRPLEACKLVAGWGG